MTKSGLAAITNLETARALIAEPGTWTQNANARRPDGNDCGPLDPRAGAYCAIGALTCAGRHDRDRRPHALAVRRLAVAIGAATPHQDRNVQSDCNAIAVWNDDPETTHADVLAAYDAAIAGNYTPAPYIVA